jgi:hypothetical protein
MKYSQDSFVLDDHEEIDGLEVASNDFLVRILGLEPGEYQMSDVSELCDFSYCGPDLGLPADAPLANLRTAWDANILARIKHVYDLDIPTTRVNMVTLLSQVDAAMKRQVH